MNSNVFVFNYCFGIKITLLYSAELTGRLDLLYQ